MKKLFFLIMMVASLLSSCSILQSKSTRAQRHLGKAISLDPSIVKSTLKDSVVITDSIRIKDSINIKDSVKITTKDSIIIIPKTVINGSLSDLCDSLTGRPRVFDYTFGAGANKVHIWSDGTTVFYTSSVDSLVSTISSRDTYISRLEETFKETERQYKERISSLEKQVITVKENDGFFRKIWKFLLPFLIGVAVGFLLRFILKIIKVIA